MPAAGWRKQKRVEYRLCTGIEEARFRPARPGANNLTGGDICQGTANPGMTSGEEEAGDTQCREDSGTPFEGCVNGVAGFQLAPQRTDEPVLVRLIHEDRGQPSQLGVAEAMDHPGLGAAEAGVISREATVRTNAHRVRASLARTTIAGFLAFLRSFLTGGNGDNGESSSTLFPLFSPVHDSRIHLVAAAGRLKTKEHRHAPCATEPCNNSKPGRPLPRC